MPIAFLRGIWRGRRCTPPPPAIRPTRGSGSANSAFSAAMMMSQASAVSNPPPIAQPFTAAIIGLSRLKRCVMPAKPFGPLGRRRPAACTFRSLPAENARSPAPVMMPTHRSSRAANSSHTAASSSFASACKRVQHLGPVQRDDADPAFILHDAVLVGHVRESSSSPCGSGLGGGGRASAGVAPLPQPPPARGAGTDSRRPHPITASFFSPPILPSSISSQSASTSSLC